MAVETRYFCNGTCGAVITQEQFDGGLTKCGTKDCSLENHEFEKESVQLRLHLLHYLK